MSSPGRHVYLLFLAIHHEVKFRSPGKLDRRERGRERWREEKGRGEKRRGGEGGEKGEERRGEGRRGEREVTAGWGEIHGLAACILDVLSVD